VQAHLEDAVQKLTGMATTVVGASRTDAGVHARGQVAAFATDSQIPLVGIRRGLNTFLPDAIRVVAAMDVPTAFNPRFDSHGKWYRYTLFCRDSASPLSRHFAWHRKRDLDVDVIRDASAPLVGEHDFSAFRATGCAAHTAVREVHSIEVTADGHHVYIDVRGNAFLRNMVRIIVGTLVDIAEGRIEPSRMRDILASRDRQQAGMTAPAHGLCLERVFFPDAE